jgi:hypothetical protein
MTSTADDALIDLPAPIRVKREGPSLEEEEYPSARKPKFVDPISNQEEDDEHMVVFNVSAAQALLGMWQKAGSGASYNPTSLFMLGAASDPEPTLADAEEKLAKSTHVDFFMGRSINVSFTDFPRVCSYAFDRVHGVYAMLGVSGASRPSSSATSSQQPKKVIPKFRFVPSSDFLTPTYPVLHKASAASTTWDAFMVNDKKALSRLEEAGFKSLPVRRLSNQKEKFFVVALPDHFAMRESITGPTRVAYGQSVKASNVWVIYDKATFALMWRVSWIETFSYVMPPVAVTEFGGRTCWHEWLYECQYQPSSYCRPGNYDAEVKALLKAEADWAADGPSKLCKEREQDYQFTCRSTSNLARYQVDVDRAHREWVEAFLALSEDEQQTHTLPPVSPHQNKSRGLF